MYNEQRKLSFINEYTLDAKLQSHCKIVFERLDPLEQQLKKDVCCFDTDEIYQAIATIAGFSGWTTRKAVYTLKRYVKWCIRNHVPGVNESLLDLSAPDARAGFVEGIERELISSPFHLQSLLDSVFRPIKHNTIHNLYRTFLWLAYSGLSEPDMMLITKNDIDWINMSIHVSNESFPIYREEVSALSSCVNLTHFEKYHPLHSKPQYLPRSEGTSIIRGLDGARYDVNKGELSKTVREACKQGKISFSLSYTNVWASGVFYNAYEREMAGLKPDFSRAVKQYYRNKGMDPNDVPLSKRNQTNKKFLADYIRWKLALNK